MATWSDSANSMMASLKFDYNLTEAQINQLRLEIGRWADMIGRQNTKEFLMPGGHRLSATAENHEIIRIYILTVNSLPPKAVACPTVEHWGYLENLKWRSRRHREEKGAVPIFTPDQ